MVFSINQGNTWKTYTDMGFVDLECNIPLKNYNLLNEYELNSWNEAAELIYTHGITPETFNTIDFNLLDASTIRFAYVLYRPSYSDVSQTNQLEWQFDAKGRFDIMNENSYEYDIYKNHIKITSLENNEIIKANLIV